MEICTMIMPNIIAKILVAMALRIVIPFGSNKYANMIPTAIPAGIPNRQKRYPLYESSA